MPNRHTTLISLFEDIADAIRAKTGDSSDIVADDFDTAIANIPTSGGNDNYFWIENLDASNESFSFQAMGGIDTTDIGLQYSTDKTNWTNYTTFGDYVTIGAHQKMYFKNTKNYFSKSDTQYIKFNCSFNCNIGGRITSLINNIDGKGLYPYAFCGLFSSNTYLLDASALILPEYTNYGCYKNMFNYCFSLSAAPALPAKIAAPYCYTNMFDTCQSLTTAPALPATVLNIYCYNGMFKGCRSLTAAPALPATTLADYCYGSMFANCAALTTAPTLPATTLANSCYSNMFDNCAALTTAPALPATTLTSSCYNSMFNGCRSLVTVPELPAKTLQYGSYNMMFMDCIALKVYTTSDTGHDKAWTIPSDGTFTSTSSQNNMFNGVETDSVPATFPAASGQSYTYYTQNTPVSAS